MYKLTAEDLDDSCDDDTPIIRAAAKSNPAVLEALLAHHAKASAEENVSYRERTQLERLGPGATVCGTACNIFASPIKSAIRAHLPHNLRLLLAAGASPDGIDRICISDYSVRWIRGRHFKDDVSSFVMCKPRAIVLSNAERKGITRQLCPLTLEELDERSHGFPRFWTEPNVPGQRLRMERALTALEVAAQAGDVECLDILRAAGADEFAWVREVSLDGKQFQIDEAKWSLSYLSMSSPVHEAIAAGQQSMLRHLLSTCGYSPNYRPYAAPTVALPPLSYAIARCNLTDPGVQKCLVDLLSHPKLDANMRTPIFNIHPLHFATARHDPDLLSWLATFIPGGYEAAGITALGHTLLHIAALPYTATQIVARNPYVAKSIHCARTLDSTWLAHRLPSPLHRDFSTAELIGLGYKVTPMTEAQQLAQLGTIRVLLEWGGVDVRAKDVEGNTALHYLAGTLNMSDETIEMVRRMEGGEEVWEKSENCYGVTPKKMWGE
jgi:ankyrin repeat protein